MDHNEYASVAGLYDTYVQTTLDIPFFVAEAQKTGGEVLELMCGTGRVSLPLAGAGARLTCVDLSAEMLAVLSDKLKQHGLQANIVQADVCKLDVGRSFDLILIPFNSFGEIVTPQSQRQALQRIWQHLAPGGRFICTLHNPAVRARSVDGKLHLWGQHPLPGGRGKLLFWGLQEFDRPDKLVVKVLQFYEEYDSGGTLRAKRLLELHFSLIDREAFESQAAEAGFKVAALYGNYDRSAFDPDHSPFLIWELRK
jgi:SAM-dependent methyltransferase